MSDKIFPSSIRIMVRYDERLQRITGEHEEPVVMSKGTIFISLLDCVFQQYPELRDVYPPGMLGFSVNGYPPKVYSPLFDGDEVYLEAAI